MHHAAGHSLAAHDTRLAPSPASRSTRLASVFAGLLRFTDCSERACDEAEALIEARAAVRKSGRSPEPSGE